MISIKKLTAHHTESVKAIELEQDQMKYAEAAVEFLTSSDKQTHLHVIFFNGQVVGFFKIDTAYSENYEFCPKGSLGLRSFVIDKKRQGQGLGTGTVKALFDYLANHYSNFESIYLTVNCQNPRAVACYQKGGFEDTDLIYHGGNAGPQHILCGPIRKNKAR